MTQDNSIPVEVTLKVSTNDFEGLWATSMNWQDTDWAAQDGRFTPMPNYNKWERAYWFDSSINLIVAKAFLDAFNVEYSQHVDTYGECDVVLLTNYGGKL